MGNRKGDTMDELTARDLTYLIRALDDRVDLAGDDEAASLRRIRTRAEAELGRHVAANVELGLLVAL